MAEEPTPTYRLERQGQMPQYTCLIPDAGRPDGLCGHISFAKDLFVQHMQQRHAGELVPEPGSEPEPDEEPNEEPAPQPVPDEEPEPVAVAAPQMSSPDPVMSNPNPV